MKTCFQIFFSLFLIPLFAYSEVVEDNQINLTDFAVKRVSEAMNDPDVEAIAIVCSTKDMHLRMGYFNPGHSGLILLKTLRLLPVYVVDTIYAKKPLPDIIYIWNEALFWYDNPNATPPPFSRLHPYPDKPVLRLVILKKEDLMLHPLLKTGSEKDFENHFESQRSKGVTLHDTLSFVGLENIITINNVFSLVDWKSALPVEGITPELPPADPRFKLVLPSRRIKQTDEANIYKVPKAFTEDVKVLIDRRQKKAKGLSVDDEEPVLKSDMGRKLSEKLMTRDEKADK